MHCCLICLSALNGQWSFIGSGGLAFDGVETLTNLMLKYNFNSNYTAQNQSNRPCEPVCSGVQNFPKPCLSHPDFKLDVLHMNLDLLDESYWMVKSILHFEQLDRTSLTGLEDKYVRFSSRANFDSQQCQPWITYVARWQYRHLLLPFVSGYIRYVLHYEQALWWFMYMCTLYDSVFFNEIWI